MFWRNVQKGIIQIATPLRQTRANLAPTIYLPVLRNDMFKKTVYYYGCSLWNELPVNVRLLDDIDDFKLNLYKHIV